MLHIGPDLVVLRRDRTPGIPWPGYLDFPGGGRENGETPDACVLRETYEEIGLRVPADALRRVHLREAADGKRHWFFAAHLPLFWGRDITLGDEGSACMLMPPKRFIAAEDAIPHFRKILAAYRKDVGP
ncbi:NUDIX hydrolase [Cognatishimia sp. F0-27]|nr:NUDIX hydrolase [Cognatishimia sp. F0-27]